MTLRTETKLRNIAAADLELVLAWRNSERIRANMYTDHLIAPEEHRAWFERLTREQAARCLIFEEKGRALGVVNVNHWDQRNGTCHWGFYLGESDAPAGSGTRMACLALDHIFQELSVRKVTGEALGFNQASISYHQKLGFSQEAHFKRQVFKNGEYQDVLSFALFAEEWQRVKPALEAKYFQGGR